MSEAKINNVAAAVVDGEEDKSEEGEKRKRAPVDKQSAYVEYKTSAEEGKAVEAAIVQYREEVKSNKGQVRNHTATINATKQEMDRVQERLQQKQDEKRAANARGASDDFGFDEDIGGNEEGLVIDEEELMLLREMKDLKRSYRENFDRLKQAKVAIADAQ